MTFQGMVTIASVVTMSALVTQLTRYALITASVTVGCVIAIKTGI